MGAYWLDLFTGTTWKEFRDAGCKVSGFSERRRKIASKFKPGDILMCYLTGVMRWVGALEVICVSQDSRQIWKMAPFPVRFDVKPLIILDPEHGIPMSSLEGKVDFFRDEADKQSTYCGFVRASPTLFRNQSDGATIFDLLTKAQKSPVKRPVDPKKLAYQPFFRTERKKGKTSESIIVSVPQPDPIDTVETFEQPVTTRHTEIQYQLLMLGSEMGFDVWVARNDRTKSWEGKLLGELPRMAVDLPTQFNEVTNKTIELIDVLWLRGNSIVTAFEVECTTSVHSGLLRMSDLLALQPNLEITLYLVAPDERRNKVRVEMRRPTFSMREKPIPEVCSFLPFSKLMEQIEGIRKLGLGSSLKPEFLDKIAERFDDEVTNT